MKELQIKTAVALGPDGKPAVMLEFIGDGVIKFSTMMPPTLARHSAASMEMLADLCEGKIP